MITITEKNETKISRTFNIISGKKEIFVSISDYQVNVIVKNASHKAYKSFGKYFSNIDKAIENYKSNEVKDALRIAAIS